ncbi:uncharacterized protein LOC133651538 [Entelurus aequoreus]|uniref:uncharacterized protein LOC133651538 n=1 Tax=Entelurus aequoreus TaxID=161455 RepID=UPI002B1DD693|nr:uncharacterized protein LOC133651538 [Entelurus aequoreus]
MSTADVSATVPAPISEAMTKESLPAAKGWIAEVTHPRESPNYEHLADTSGLASTLGAPVVPKLYRAIACRAAPLSPTFAAASSTCVAAAASATSAAAATTCASTKIPRSTAWYSKKKALNQGFINALPPKHNECFRCKLCGFPKNKEHGHSRYRNETFCSRSQGLSVEEWLAEKRSQKTPRQRQIQHMRGVRQLQPRTIDTTSRLRKMLPKPQL